MDKLTFISWNVNGIRAVDKKEALKWVDGTEILDSIMGSDHCPVKLVLEA